MNAETVQAGKWMRAVRRAAAPAMILLLLCSCSAVGWPGAGRFDLVNAGEAAVPDGSLQAIDLDAQAARATARILLDEAKKLKSELRHIEAEERLERAVRLDATLTEAQMELDSVRFLLGRLVGERAETIRKIEQDQVLQIQQAQAQLRRLFAEGEAHYAAREYGAALEKYRRVIEIDSYYPWHLNLPELVDLARQRAAQAEQLYEDQQVSERRTQEALIRQRVEYTRMHDLRYFKNRIRQLKTRGQEAYDAGRYDAAEMFASHALELDPHDREAQVLRHRARHLRHLFVRDRLERDTARNWNLVLRSIEEAAVPYQKVFQFPPRRVWEKLGEDVVSLEDRVAAEEPIANRDVRRLIEQTRIQRVSFENRPLREVLGYLAQISGVTFVPNREAREAMEVGLDVNLPEVQNLTLKNILDIILEGLGSSSYGYRIESGAVVIGPQDSLAQTMYLEFYPVEEIAKSRPNFPAPPLAVRLADESRGGIADFTLDTDAAQGPVLPPENLAEMIDKRIFNNDEKNGTVKYQGGKLVVRTTIENHRKIAELLESLRQLTGVQVSVEARFLDVQDNLLEEIGVDIGGPVESALEYPIPDVNSLGTSVAAGFTFLDESMRYESRAANISNYSGVLGTEITPFNITPRGGMALQWNLLRDYQLEAILTAVQKTQKTRTLDAPRVIAFDGQTAHTMVIDQIAYIKDVDVNQTGVSPVINPLIGSFRVGSLLEIRPTVTYDRKFVMIEVKPTTATHIDSKFADLSLAQGYTLVQVELPVILLAQIQTTITIPDGGTVLVGGLKKVIQQTKSIGIPGLQRIPVLNVLFGRRGQTQLRNSLFIMIKADILIVQEEERVSFP